MTHDELKTKVEELEALIKRGSDYALAETQAQELLKANSIEEGTGGDRELHCRILLALSESLWRRGMAQDALPFSEQALTITEQIASKKLQAKALGNIGGVYGNLSDYSLALEYYGKALSLNEALGNKAGMASNLGNIGTVHLNLSDYPRALEYHTKALALAEELGNKAGMARHFGNIGLVHSNLSDYSLALEYLGKALSLNEELGNKAGVANYLGNIGNVHANLSDYALALEYYGKALALAEELGDKASVAINLGNIGATYAQQDFDGYNPDKAEEYLLLAIDLFTEIGYKAALIEFHKTLSDLYEHEQRFGDAFTHFKKYIAIKDEVNVEEVKKQESLRDQQKQAAEREKEMEIDRTRFQERENILNNILPEEITQRLIKGENPIADHYDGVSVLFMDIVDFTTLCTKVSAQQLVHLLNAIFTAADGVMREFGLEKIKTIGDAYMAVAGAPESQEDHAIRAASASIALLDRMNTLHINIPSELGDISWIESIGEIGVRIGIHSGEAIGGVIGDKKFSFDLWGDAVNTASRMESHGEAGKIHISEEFKHAVETVHAPSLRFIPRGDMEIKGKGMMKTYFLEKVSAP
jgi:adenylate cyclase